MKYGVLYSSVGCLPDNHEGPFDTLREAAEEVHRDFADVLDMLNDDEMRDQSGDEKHPPPVHILESMRHAFDPRKGSLYYWEIVELSDDEAKEWEEAMPKMYSPRYGKSYPSINVKFHGDFGPGVKKVLMEKYGATEEDAQRAIDLCWNDHIKRFWDDAQEDAENVFGDGVEVYGEGRSGGHLVVHGLQDPEEYPSAWDGTDGNLEEKWDTYVGYVRSLMEDLASHETVLDTIEENEWYKPYSKTFNFYERKDGSTVCLADVEAKVDAYRQGLLDGSIPL